MRVKMKLKFIQQSIEVFRYFFIDIMAQIKPVNKLTKSAV